MCASKRNLDLIYDMLLIIGDLRETLLRVILLYWLPSTRKRTNADPRAIGSETQAQAMTRTESIHIYKDPTNQLRYNKGILDRGGI